MGKGNLNQAKVNKNDEFYTRLTDIEKELRYYRDQLKGKHIFMNCDDPDWSNFWQYFELNFKFLGLKKITSTHYHDTESTQNTIGIQLMSFQELLKGLIYL